MGKSLAITVKGRIPSKKNSKQWIKCGNRRFLVSSKNHQIWHKEQSYRIKRFCPKKPIEKCVVIITFYAPDKRIADLSNKAESIMDLLVDNRFIVDDSWFVVENLSLYFGGIDRDNPRAIIKIIIL